MKFSLFLAVFVFGSFFIAQKLLAANTDIVINEIGSYATSTHEWIEVWNKGNSSIDLSSWKFWENSTNHSLKAVTTSDNIISPDEYAVICQDGDVFLRDYPNFIGSVLDSAWSSLSENGEEIGLKDENGNFVEKFTYLPTNYFSLERKDSILNDYLSTNWQENLLGNTVGGQNSNFAASTQDNISTSTTSTLNTTTTIITSTTNHTSTPTTTEVETNTSTVSLWDWAFIKLNEILSDPNEGNEKIELYNSGSTTAEIVLGSICDSTGSGCKIFSGNILSHGWLIVDLLTDRYLNNSGDSVILKDENNNTVDEVSYGTDVVGVPSNEQSLIRKLDGVDTDGDNDWALTTNITLGKANQLVVPVVNSNIGGGGQVGGSLGNTGSIINTSTATKTLKFSTTTVKSVIDPIKISWKLDWPYGLDIGEDGVFSARGSADPRGGDINVVWNFGDNTTSSGFTALHRFVSSGIYLVSVSGTSTAGTNGKKDFKIYIGPEFSSLQSQIKIESYLVEANNSDDEFINLQNFSTSTHNISGWKIKNKSGKEYQIPENTNISASGTLKFFRSITHLSFDKDGDEIRLTSPNDKEIYTVILKNMEVIKKEAEKKLKKETKILKTTSVGSWKVVQGVVTALPGSFGSQYFYISDGEKGYQIYQYKKDFPNLKIGYKVTVHGEESQISGVSRIKIVNKNYISIAGKDENFEPLRLEDVDVQAIGALVKIEGDITSIKNNYLYIDNGIDESMIYFRIGANINKQDFKLGDKLEVVGILEQTKSGLRISPRDESDIKVIGFSEQVLLQQTELDRALQNDVQEKYLTATAGGITTLILGFLAKSRGAIVMGGAKKVISTASKIIGRG